MNTLREHVRSQTATLLRRFAFQVKQATIRSDEDVIHDLRVSIRRLRESLRTFKDLYPASARKKVRKELKTVMKAAERVRSADIALELLKKAGSDDSGKLVHELRAERDGCRMELHKQLKALGSRSYTRSWRKELVL